MPLVNAYVTPEQVRHHLGDTTNNLSEEQLIWACNGSSRAVDNWCSPPGKTDAGRRFWRDTTATSRVYVPDDERTVWTLDISSTTGLVVATDAGGDGTYETAWMLGTDYHAWPLSADVAAAGDTVTPYAFWILKATGSRLVWPVSSTGFPTVQVTTRYGWSALPDEVFSASLLKAASLFRRKDAPFGVAGFGELGVVRITRKDVDVLELLEPYRKTRPRTLTCQVQRSSLFHRRPWGY